MEWMSIGASCNATTSTFHCGFEETTMDNEAFCMTTHVINFLWDSQKAKKKCVSTSVICSFIVVIMSNYIWFRGLYVNQMLIHSMFEWVTIMISNENKTTSNKLNGMSKKKLIFIVLILFLFVSSILLITNTQETSRVSLKIERNYNFN